MIKRVALVVAVVIVVFASKSTVYALELPDIMSSNMVLQQQSEAKLWGWSKPGTNVAITTSWDNKHYNTKAKKDGAWEVYVTTPVASYTPFEIEISDGEAVKLSNVLIGEVWFCSGQSNMEMPLNGFWTQPIEHSDKLINYSGKYRNRIRMASVPKTGALEPMKKTTGVWKESNPENAQWFSAVGYTFAQTLTELLDIPVGIINCSWGGSHVKGWLPKEELAKYADVNIADAADTTVQEWSRPMIMYNGMLHPLIGYTIKGFLWNQGESNVGRHDLYPYRLADMVAYWRKMWGNGELPFYSVELPPYSYGDVNGTSGALLRESQHKSAEIIPNSAVVCTSDLVYPHEVEDVHASRKQEIGERLGFLAAARDYGIAGIHYKNPTFKSMEVNGNVAILHFDNAPDGFTPNRDIEGFEVAGDDRVFYPANAIEIYDSRDIKVTSDKVDNIVSVRYCFKNWAIGTVHSLRWLPLVPFRTDNWEN